MLLMRANPLRGRAEGGFALWNDIEPSGECHIGPKKVAMLCHTRTKQHLNLALALALWNHLTVCIPLVFSFKQNHLGSQAWLNGRRRITACNLILYSRKYWMMNREPGFFAAVLLAPPHPPFPPSPFSKLDRRHRGRLRKKDNLPTVETRGWEWERSPRRRENLFLYKSFSTLCFLLSSWLQKYFSLYTCTDFFR